MSTVRENVHEKVRALYEAGHAGGETPDLWLDPRIEQIETFRPAAVLIAFTEREEPGMLLLHRPSTMRAHPGQVAFPGGKRDPGETPEETALRETYEELGIAPSEVKVIGRSDIYRTGSGYEITPVLATVRADIEIRPNPAEVAQWFEAPAAFVLDPANHTTREVDYKGNRHSFNEVIWDGHRIWGVTGAIVSNLARRLAWHG